MIFHLNKLDKNRLFFKKTGYYFMILCLCNQGVASLPTESKLLVGRVTVLPAKLSKVKGKKNKFRNFRNFFVILHCYNVSGSLEDEDFPKLKNKIQRRKI